MSERRQDLEYFLSLIDDTYRVIKEDFLAEETNVVSYKVETPEVLKDDLFNFNREIEDCHKCPCWKDREGVILSRGQINPKIMFISGISSDEDLKRGKALCGDDGKMIASWAKSIELSSKDCYFALLKKCHSNVKDEGKCNEIIIKEIGIVRPRVIVLVGGETASLVTNNITMDSLKQKYELNGIPTFLAPAPKRIVQNQNLRLNLWETLCKAKEIINEG